MNKISPAFPAFPASPTVASRSFRRVSKPFFCLALLLLLSIYLLPMRLLAEERIVVDLARYDVPISTGFSGAELLLFGASPGEGDILIKVSGPAQNYLVMRKQRFAGLWMSGERVRVLGAPAFFHVLSSGRNGDNWLSSFESSRMDFSIKDLYVDIVGADGQLGSSAERQQFRDAFVRSQRDLLLYGESRNSIERLGNNLFRANLSLPAGLPTGTYIVETFLVNEGKLLSAQSTPLFVRRSGSAALVFDFAERYSFLYGLCAVLLALAAGFLANRLFVWR